MKTLTKKNTTASLQKRTKALIAKIVREEMEKPMRRVGRLPASKGTSKPQVATARARSAATTGKAGKGHKTKRAARAATRSGKSTGKATAASMPAGTDPVPARYGQAFYGQAHYVTDTPTPVPGKAKVKLELKARTDADLVGFAHSHDQAMQGNVYFPTPQPTTAVFDSKLAELEAIMAQLDNNKVMAKNLTEQRDAVRAQFEQLFTQRGTYVELTSEGDANWIATTGLPIRNMPVPVGVLPWPLSLRAEVTQTEGELYLRWDAVYGARSYQLEVADGVDNVAVNWRTLYMGGKPSTVQSGFEPGKMYVFRVCAVGGEGGRSGFCPEVWRMAA